MKLGKKIVIAIGLVWILFFIAIYISSESFLLNSFFQLENTHAKDDAYRVQEAFLQQQILLKNFITDWGHWDDLYDFMNDKNPTFIKNNIVKSALVKLNIDYLGFIDNNHKLVYQFKANPSIALGDHLDQSKDGIIQVNDQLYFIAISDITDSYKQKESRGKIIAGRLIDLQIIDTLRMITKMDISLYTLNQIKQDSLLLNIFDKLASDNRQDKLILYKNSKLLDVYALVRDYQEHPVAFFDITMPRTISAIGLKTINYYLFAIVLLAVLFSLLLFWIIDSLVINRLRKLDSTITSIKKQKQLDQRVNIESNDELSSVSTAINEMLDIIQASQETLEHQVEERTKELALSKERLAKLAHYDDVTLLPNRVFFNELLNKAITSAKRHKEILAILFIDLDHFKKINDAFGHGMGDQVLNKIGQRFKEVLRSEDVIARSGGDEFIILLSNIKEEKYAGFVAEKIIKSCENPIRLNELEFFIDVSIGISIFPTDGSSLEDLQKNADMAMYKAKKSGGSIYHYYTNEMEMAAHEYIKMEALLRKALLQNEFELYFQPQLTLANGTINHAEALIRWNNPEIGLVAPDHFIPLAEKIGFIIPIGEWAIKEVCRINKAWQDAGYDPITVAVNISAKQFHHQDVVHIIHDALINTKLDPQYLEVEVTESAIMENVELTITKLKAIHELGVSISIDDFGTGYTSINYLRQFPVNILKIDQTFIKGIPQQANDIAITSAVIALAHNLGLKVIAEGVETKEQIQFLVNNQCDMIQGYYLSRPLPAGEMIEFFRV